MSKRISYRALITRTSRRCPVCRATIDEDGYCLKVKTGKDKAIYIHDNEGACLEVHKVSLGLAKPTILSAILARNTK